MISTIYITKKEEVHVKKKSGTSELTVSCVHVYMYTKTSLYTTKKSCRVQYIVFTTRVFWIFHTERLLQQVQQYCFNKNNRSELVLVQVRSTLAQHVIKSAHDAVFFSQKASLVHMLPNQKFRNF